MKFPKGRDFGNVIVKAKATLPLVIDNDSQKYVIDVVKVEGDGPFTVAKVKQDEPIGYLGAIETSMTFAPKEPGAYRGVVKVHIRKTFAGGKKPIVTEDHYPIAVSGVCVEET